MFATQRKGVKRKSPNPLKFLVGRGGIEPPMFSYVRIPKITLTQGTGSDRIGVAWTYHIAGMPKDTVLYPESEEDSIKGRKNAFKHIGKKYRHDL